MYRKEKLYKIAIVHISSSDISSSGCNIYVCSLLCILNTVWKLQKHTDFMTKFTGYYSLSENNAVPNRFYTWLSSENNILHFPHCVVWSAYVFYNPRKSIWCAIQLSFYLFVSKERKIAICKGRVTHVWFYSRLCQSLCVSLN